MTRTRSARPTITDLGRALRRRETSATRLTEDALRIVADQDPILNAFALVDEAGAREAAERADRELAEGTDRGPLHGIPVAVKDIIDVAGLPTTCGSATAFGTGDEGGASRDAEVITRLHAHGAVIIGKTTLHEFAYGSTGDRSIHGPSRNPHDPGRISGGSSGGSAVAVASGMVALSLGTDTVGSVRGPAALCGVVGFKPAFEAISSAGVYPLAPSLDHVGLLARCVSDALIGYRALADRPPSAQPCDPRSLTVGWIRAGDFATVDPRIEELAHLLLTRAGLTLEQVDEFPRWTRRRPLFDLVTTLQSREAFEVHQHHLDADRDLIDPEVLARLEHGARVSTSSYEAAIEAREELRATVRELLRTYDLLALPTVPIVAPPIGARSVPVDGAELEVRSALLSLTSPWNLTGDPAISIPASRLDGLPTAVQLIAAPGNEHLLFAASQQLQAVR